MVRLANFTLHDQSEYVGRWREFGFEIDPAPRAPLIEFEKGERTEESILEAVIDKLDAIKAGGFDAILIGGLSNCMAYAWLLASRYGLQAVMARTPRKRTPTGEFVFELAGYSILLSPQVVKQYPDTRIIDRAMQDTRRNLLKGDALQAVGSLVVAFETLEEMVTA